MVQRLGTELDSLQDNPNPVEELEVILERFQHIIIMVVWLLTLPLSRFSNIFPPQHCKMMEIKIKISKCFLKHQMDQGNISSRAKITIDD